MKNEQEIRWIQLSDLHMFISTDVECQKKALHDQFGSGTDLVIVTGDLHQYGEAYNMTKDFLNQLVEGFHIDKEDVVIIPGNHDACTTKKRKEAMEKIDKNIENNVDIYLNELDKLYSGFSKYCGFLNGFYEKINDKHNLLENHIYNWKNKLAILCINTALISDEDHNKPQIVDIYKLQKLNALGLPCIAIMHHDYYSISDMHKPYIKNKFSELGVSAILSGHKHKYSKNVVEIEDKKIIPNYCCAKSVSQPGDLWSDIGIIEYRWKQNENKVRVIPYEWNKNKNAFIPSLIFEDESKCIVNQEGSVEFTNNFNLISNPDNKIKVLACNSIEEKEGEEIISDLEIFYQNVQMKYLDNILELIGDDERKFGKAVDIMERVITYGAKKINFEQIVSLIVSCNSKVVLAINGLPGTGKSTFLSLVYYNIKNKYYESKVFPILIDLHALHNYSKKQAKAMLLEDLERIDVMIKKYGNIKFILLFDGADDYIRKTTELEEVIYNYVNNRTLNNFAFCIGSAEYLPDEVCKASALHHFSRKAMYKLETHRIEKGDEDNISAIINNVVEIYGFSVKSNEIGMIKKVINVYTINEIDYRTLLIILRVFETNLKNMYDYQLGNCFYDYYLMEMNSDECKLFKLAQAAYQYIVLKDQNALRSLKYAKYIYNNGITIDFLLAYYFVSLVKKGGENLSKVLKGPFVFTASVNKFIKDLILNKYKGEQIDIVGKLINAFDISDMSMKSQISYILGRIQDSNAKEMVKNFLINKWETLYSDLFKEDKLVAKELDIKSQLVLFRTISVSLIWIGYDKKQEQFLRCLLLNEKLNQINRGFHLEYYEDKSYMNGVSPTYVDDEKISVNKTMKYLIDNINKGFSRSQGFNKSIYLDIVTLFSIYQYRLDNPEIEKQYGKILIDLAEKILQSTKIQSRTIINYIITFKQLVTNNPYKNITDEIYRVKLIKREGWVRRRVTEPESIADHMYGCYMLGVFFLPNNVQQCIDYHIPDIDNYRDYSKQAILEMLLLHDFAEVKIGDIVTQEKELKDKEEENKFFDYYEFLCSFPHIYGLGNQKKAWNEFIGNSTINAKIANDIDKIEPLIQANIYKTSGNKIDLNEWEEYAIRNVHTSLGRQFLQFIKEKIIV